MLGAGLQFGRGCGDDRIYNPTIQGRQNDQLQGETENGDWCEELPISSSVSAFEPVVSSLSNLQRFLKSIVPSIPAQYLSKATIKGWGTCDVEFQPYFVLGDLWEFFEEWSAYGAGVPLVLNDSDSVVQYYAPYLSGIQIYGESLKSSAKSRISLHDQLIGLREDCSNDEAKSLNSQGQLLFEHFECAFPHTRVTLADKISDLAFKFPELKTLRSNDLLPSSWFSVAWYPIYRIPIGRTFTDLDACFLTFHYLSTPMGGGRSVHSPVVTYPSGKDGLPRMSLPVFGLASYKFEECLSTLNGEYEWQLANSLLHDAEDWLRQRQVNHPDFIFFRRQ